ncbi:MAG: hypothetical protein Q8N59_03280 [bacterium]|nr:hypothetical protein [bacterium]
MAIKRVKKFRLQFDFTQEQVSALDNMVKKTNGTTRAGVLRQAISFFDWFINQGIENKPINLPPEQVRMMCAIFTKKTS